MDGTARTLLDRSVSAAGRRRTVWRGVAAALVVLFGAPVADMPMAAANDPAAGIRLTLLVDGVRSDDGIIRVALYRSADGFATREGQWREIAAPARRGTTAVPITDLPPGTYGIAAFHDENGNDRFDTTLLGLPKEGFGFGNDAPVRFGPPDFDEAAVTLAAGTAAAESRLTLSYW